MFNSITIVVLLLMAILNLLYGIYCSLSKKPLISESFVFGAYSITFIAFSVLIFSGSIDAFVYLFGTLICYYIYAVTFVLICMLKGIEFKTIELSDQELAIQREMEGVSNSEFSFEGKSSIRKCLTVNYNSFEGRADIREFWSFFAFRFIVTVVLSIIVSVCQFTSFDFTSRLICALFYWGTFIPALAVTCRRLHDINKSGWLQIFEFIPFGFIINTILFYIKPSSPMKNRFG